MRADEAPLKILFVFAWLVVGGEETEVRLLAEHLDPKRFRLDVVACFRKENMPEQTHLQLDAAGLWVDKTPYGLPFEAKVEYLAGKMAGYDLVVSCQNPAELYPALERLTLPPPLIEHGGLVAETVGPKHLTARYVGVCAAIREAAAARLPGRAQDALEIPSMVDLAEFDAGQRDDVRAELGIAADAPLIGWVGRLDAKKRVEDFVAAAALVAAERPAARFLVVGGPDAFMPDYAERLVAQASALGLDGTLRFLGDRADVARLLAGLDIFAWLARGEGMPHVIAEAGAASLPVIATRDGGTVQQIEDGVSGLFVPHEDPAAVAAAMLRLIEDALLRACLGSALRVKVERDYSTAAVIPRWEALFEEVAAQGGEPARPTGLFKSFFQGGFESSTHVRGVDRRRLDLIASTRHDRLAESDYRLLGAHGIATVRDGLRWHLVEASPGRFDWSSLDPLIAAAEATGTQVVWDLLHYGWPDHLDVWSEDFPARFAAFAAAAAGRIGARLPGPHIYAPINEVSFFAWGGGQVGYLNPFAHDRGEELKCLLVRTAIAAMDAIRAVDPAARFVHGDPVINVLPPSPTEENRGRAEFYRLLQFHAWDMIGGYRKPELGGRPDYLDILGINYYWNNQWIGAEGTWQSNPIDLGHPDYTPFSKMLREVYRRYGRPLFISETGIEGERRPAWLSYIAGEVRAAMAMGVPVEGICLYPVLDHPGWDDDRYCPNGLLGLGAGDERSVDAPLAAELSRQRARLADLDPGAVRSGATSPVFEPMRTAC